MKDDKLYLSNSMKMASTYDTLFKSSSKSIPSEIQRLVDACQKREINGPAHANHIQVCIGQIMRTDHVFCIHYDKWPNSANSFITRHRPNNWPSDSMLENIQGQGCDVVPVGHYNSKNNYIQWRISFRVSTIYF